MTTIVKFRGRDLSGLPAPGDAVESTANITDHALVIYNKSFDIRLIAQSYQPAREARYRRVFCAMAMAAAWFEAERISLVDAVKQAGIEMPAGKPHRAAYDCELTRRLLLYMGG
jgi:DNA polymerase III epsilon subunit-like protein